MFVLYSINKSYKSQHLFITFYKLFLADCFPSVDYVAIIPQMNSFVNSMF